MRTAIRGRCLGELCFGGKCCLRISSVRIAVPKASAPKLMENYRVEYKQLNLVDFGFIPLMDL